MALRKQKPIIWLALAAIVLLIIIIQRQPVGQYLNIGMTPLIELFQAPANAWQRTSLWFEERSKLQSEYTRLREQLERQAPLIQEVNSLREENRQLKSLLAVSELEGFHWHAAKVEGRSPDTMSQRLIVRAEGVDTEDVIVSSEGLVGLVDEVSAGRAVVRTVLDASIAVPVSTGKDGVAALVRGLGNSLRIDFIPFERAPEPGTVVRTSGAGGLFPPGIPVARITKVEKREGIIFADVEAVPVAHWQRDNWLAIASADER